MKLCMASHYDIKNKRTWSGTTLSLYNALNEYDENDITAINLSQYRTNAQIKLSAAANCDILKSIKQRQIVSKLGPSANNPLYSKILNKLCKGQGYDAVLEFGGFKAQKNFPPYYVYSDSSHDMKLDYFNKYGYMPFGSENDNLDEVRRASEYSKEIYLKAQGVLCMSQWLADTMINTTGVDPKKVHVVYAGANWHDCPPPENIKPKSISGKKEIHLLLTGVSYSGKGVDLACDAVDLLNKSSELEYYLHICGIKEDFEHSEHIINHHFVAKPELSELLKKCDLFVLPSRFDCFGISFVEAMTYALPCIGRNICAMPEIIDKGMSGELVTRDDPLELAGLIDKICSDEELYSEYSQNALNKSQRFTWQRVAGDIMDIIR
ncbi:MAG: glycosyltransferase family 4 protein [Acutalibacteraceae bacterium]